MTTTEPTTEATPVAPNGLSRRGFLGVTGLAGLALVAAACGNENDAQPNQASGDDKTTTTGGGAAAGDAAIAQLAAGLEVLAVGTYKAGLDAATAGKLGEVPPAVAEYAKTAMEHHQEHLDAWNGVLSDAGAQEVTEPNATLKPTVDAEFAKVKDVTGLAKLALMLEQIAADTYLSAQGVLESDEALRLAGSIQAVDRQHQAILHFALGEYPVPQVFQDTKQAAKA